MAEGFTADRREAARVSRDLAAIRTSLDGEKLGAEGDTGSQRIDGALRTFFEESSDNREKLDQLLGRATGLLDGLVRGTGELDRSLGESLEKRADDG
jgi:hypothetical protein